MSVEPARSNIIQSTFKVPPFLDYSWTGCTCLLPQFAISHLVTAARHHVVLLESLKLALRRLVPIHCSTAGRSGVNSVLAELVVSAAPCFAGEMQACCVPSSLSISQVPTKCKEVSLNGKEVADTDEQVKFH